MIIITAARIWTRKVKTLVLVLDNRSFQIGELLFMCDGDQFLCQVSGGYREGVSGSDFGGILSRILVEPGPDFL